MASPKYEISISDLSQFLKKPVADLRSRLAQLDPSSSFSTTVSPVWVRQLALEAGVIYHRKIISFQMLKGGVAKTTSALNVGLRAAMYGARVLFVDLDQQANLTYSLGVDGEDKNIWLDIVEKKCSIDKAILSLEPHVDLIPSSLNNSVLDRVLINSQRNWSLSVLQPLRVVSHNYDLIIIDTAPALSAVNTAATVASTEVVLPLNPDKFSWLGLKKNLEELAEIKNEFQLNFNLKILLTRFDAREKSAHEILQKCQSEFKDELISTIVRSSSQAKNTIAGDKTIYQTSSTIKEDYDQVSKFLMGIPPSI